MPLIFLREMPRKTLIAGISLLVVIAMLAIGVAADTSISLYAVNRSQTLWCTALELLVKDGVVTPQQNAEGLLALYRLHEAYVQLEKEFGCKV